MSCNGTTVENWTVGKPQAAVVSTNSRSALGARVMCTWFPQGAPPCPAHSPLDKPWATPHKMSTRDVCQHIMDTRCGIRSLAVPSHTTIELMDFKLEMLALSIPTAALTSFSTFADLKTILFMNVMASHSPIVISD